MLFPVDRGACEGVITGRSAGSAGSSLGAASDDSAMEEGVEFSPKQEAKNTKRGSDRIQNLNFNGYS